MLRLCQKNVYIGFFLISFYALPQVLAQIFMKQSLQALGKIL